MNKPILILVSGSNQIDVAEIEIEVAEAITKADADFVRSVTGFAIGGIPPIGHKNNIELIYIDADLLCFDTVWAAAGTPNTVFSISSQDLLRVTQAKIVSFSKCHVK